MVAAKSLITGMIIAATGILLGQSCQAGGIITAGTSGGRLYYGGQTGSWSSNYSARTTVVLGSIIPASNDNPTSATPTAPAAPSQPTEVQGLFASSPTPAPMMVAAGTTYVSPSSVTLPPISTPNPATNYDAFINFGTAPYADQGLLTTGTAQSWTTSPALLQAYGHTPSSSELANFSQDVLQRVQSTFASSGLSITATTDPTARAGHMLSVVSGLSAASSPDAIGITNVGHNGFDFIDKLAFANSPDQLEWAVAHNVAHELMHAFGGEHHTTPENNNLDAPMSDWSVMIDPNTKFSAASVAEMTYNLRQGGLAMKYGVGAEMLADGQELNSMPVPEPATFVMWGLFAGIGCLIHRKSRVARRAA